MNICFKIIYIHTYHCEHLKNPDVMQAGTSGQLPCFGSPKNLVKGNGKTKLYQDNSFLNKELFKTDLGYPLKIYTVPLHSQFQKILIKNSI